MLVLSPRSQCCILLFLCFSNLEHCWLPIYRSVLRNVIYEPLMYCIVARLTPLVSPSRKSLLSKEKGRMSALDGRETLDGSSRVLSCPSRSAMS